MPLPFSGPRLRVAPRRLEDDRTGEFGRHEVLLELERFDRRFPVRAEDARFAVAFLDQRMMRRSSRCPAT